jgi:hypothetical protein
VFEVEKNNWFVHQVRMRVSLLSLSYII